MATWLRPAPRPASRYQEAVARGRAEQPPLTLLDHGRRVPRALVLLPDPVQGSAPLLPLAEHLHARGFNVLLSALPNPLSTAPGWVEWAARAVDIAQGMARAVALLGMGAGGVAAAWAAQQRADLSLVLLLDPLFVPDGIPRGLLPFLPLAARGLPERAIGSPRYPLPALAALYRLYRALHRMATTERAAAHAIVLVTHPPLAPPAAALMGRWQRGGKQSLYHRPLAPGEGFVEGVAWLIESG